MIPWILLQLKAFLFLFVYFLISLALKCPAVKQSMNSPIDLDIVTSLRLFPWTGPRKLKHSISRKASVYNIAPTLRNKNMVQNTMLTRNQSAPPFIIGRLKYK